MPAVSPQRRAKAEQTIRRAVADRLLAERRRDRAILAAHDLGVPMREIAKWASLSHQRIHQIVRAPQIRRGE
jgi:hypothetical protein